MVNFLSIDIHNGFGLYVSVESGEPALLFNDEGEQELAQFTGMVFYLPFIRISVGTMEWL